jgi:arylsulfatase A-like enzyme
MLTDADIPAANTPMGKAYRRDVKDYYASITGVDAQIGRIVNALKERKMFDNTIIVFVADHGNCLGKHDEESKNNIYEESLRIPFIICWKGKIKPSMDDSFLGSMPDIYPTLLDLAGFKNQIPQTIDGKSYADYFLKGKGAQPAEQIIMGSMAYDTLQMGQSGFRGIRTAHYKLAYQRKNKKLEAFLFDIQADPFEQHNLYSKDNLEVKLMKPKLAAWLKQHNDPFKLDEE